MPQTTTPITAEQIKALAEKCGIPANVSSRGFVLIQYNGDWSMKPFLPNEDLNDMALLRNGMKTAKVRTAFIEALRQLLLQDKAIRSIADSDWALLNATPEQQTRAALVAFGIE